MSLTTVTYPSDQHGKRYPWADELDRLSALRYEAAATGVDGKTLKYNEGKVDLSLVHPFFTRELAKVFEYGLTKYARDSWQEFDVDDAKKLIAAAMRHTDQYREGEYYDTDSGLPHLMSAAWNLMIIHYHITQGGKQRGDAIREGNAGEEDDLQGVC